MFRIKVENCEVSRACFIFKGVCNNQEVLMKGFTECSVFLQGRSMGGVLSISRTLDNMQGSDLGPVIL